MNIQGVSPTASQATARGSQKTLAPGAVLRAVLSEGFARSPSAVKSIAPAIAGAVDWTSVCAVAYRCRIAPIVYQSLRASALAVPPDVMEWFRVQHYDNVARNLASLNELRAVLNVFEAAGIRVVVFKGPALAEAGYGMARTWQDLDLLIRGDAVERVDAVLLRSGYPLRPEPPHHNHRRYGGGDDGRRGVLEVHFDISDPLRSHRPNVDAVWVRAVDTKILGITARVPEITDHLLLTMMQLPHHHWSIRLLLDLRQVIERRRGDIDWDEVFQRAGAWQMMALTKSALASLQAEFGLTLPDGVRERVRAGGYYDRLHREIAAQAITEQLENPFRPKVMWIAPFVVVDHAGRVPAIIVRRLLAGGQVTEDGRVGRALRRNRTSLAALPALCRVLLASLRR